MALNDGQAFTADGMHFVPTYVHGPLCALARPGRVIHAQPQHTWSSGYWADLDPTRKDKA